MRRTLLTTSLITAAGLALTGVSTCGPQGPAARDFAAGSLVIPMDNCYQKRDGTPASQTVGCNATADDGVFRAYGLVYFLLKNNITVYWAINDKKSTPSGPTGIDVTVPAPGSGSVATKFDWAGGAFVPFGFPAGQPIKYIGGPFLIDAADAARAIGLFNGSADVNGDFLKFRTEKMVDIHQVNTDVPFNVAQVRTLAGKPPRIAILAVNPKPYHKTSLDVMYRYAVAAGLDDPTCNGVDNCAGGLGANCDATVIQKYLNNTLCGGSCDLTACSSCSAWVDPANAPPSGIQTAKFNAPGNPGKIFDILCDGDFIPPQGGSYANTQLALGDYKLLWVPHWDTGGTNPLHVPATTAEANLNAQLQSIASYVNDGNNLFAECLGIQVLEGVAGQDSVNGNTLGIPATRFQSPGGIKKWNGTGGGALALQALIDATHPNVQIGDFPYSVVSGAITTYFPDVLNTIPNAAYRPGIKRFVTETPTTTPPPTWDVSSTIQVIGADNIAKGNVAYLGGHDYSPGGSTPQTAGTRIVLNTLFNLGFGCSDPNTTCPTGLLGDCALGVMKCAGGGGLQCKGLQPGALDCKTLNADANCNGIPDHDEAGCHPSTCDNGDGTTTASGASHSCYANNTDVLDNGTNKSHCKAGTRTCSLGVWGPCNGEQLPQPEVCNGLDDNCDGTVDEGALCASGYACQAGICLPSACNGESARCPASFQCLTSGGPCTGVPCAAAGGGACAAGTVCQAGQCVDPCKSITCGDGAGCSGGQCVSGGCALTGCTTAGQVCVAGSCTADPCAGNTCPVGTFCRVGPQVSGTYVADCVRSCSYVGCPDGQTCGEDGFCQAACSPVCGTGQVCVNGACAADPCAGVLCGAGQECRDHACVDAACAHVSCPLAGSSCSVGVGQCVGGNITTSQATPIKPKASGGCGTGGGGDLSTLAFLAIALALASHRRRLAPAFAAASRWAAPVAVALLLALGTSCSKKGDPACTAQQTACGADCADLETSSLHCGACGHGCVAGFQCVAGGCSLPTGNPHLVSVAPATIGINASPKLVFTFDGLDAQHPASGLKVRLTGAVVAQELPLTVDGNTATLAAQLIQLNGEATGTIEARLLNGPSRLVSNPLDVTVGAAIVARTLSPALGQQDQTAAVTLDLLGLGFVQGATVTMAPTGGGAPQQLTTTVISAGELTATAPAPSTLKVGRYDVTVTNPDGTASSPLAFTVTDGAPTITSISGSKGSCVVGGGPFTGTILGTYLYPDTVAHVSGNTILNSPLATTCLTGTDALGKCQGGQVQVSADLSAVPLGTYQLKVVNPGAPPLESAAQPITVVAGSCP
jgi:hypothetical protein